MSSADFCVVQLQIAIFTLADDQARSVPQNGLRTCPRFGRRNLDDKGRLLTASPAEPRQHRSWDIWFTEMLQAGFDRRRHRGFRWGNWIVGGFFRTAQCEQTSSSAGIIKCRMHRVGTKYSSGLQICVGRMLSHFCQSRSSGSIHELSDDSLMEGVAAENHRLMLNFPFG